MQCGKHTFIVGQEASLHVYSIQYTKTSQAKMQTKPFDIYVDQTYVPPQPLTATMGHCYIGTIPDLLSDLPAIQ